MLKSIIFRPGVNRENTRYASEVIGSVSPATQVVGGWYESEKVRFRAGSPEKIGGWRRISASTFRGVCRSLWNWVTLSGLNIVGVGTNLKFYIERGGAYYDITPLRGTATLTNPFTATNGSSVILVADVAHGCATGDFVTFSGATGLGGNVSASVLNQDYQVTVVTSDSYNITVGVLANATDAAGSPGGGTVSAAYQINVGPEFQQPTTGWGAGPWSVGPWGVGSAGMAGLRTWSQRNFGEDLIFAPRDGPIYYWDATGGVSTRGVLLSTLGGASDVPTVQKFIFVSDISRFVFAFGCNELGDTVQNPMLIRWSDQESAADWTPAATGQAGSIQLSDGSELVACLQTRQEIVVWTDSALYSMQYVGVPAVWSTQLLGSNISIYGQNAASVASGVVYWMGVDKFYKYDGRVQTLRCDLREYIFSDINQSQNQQVFSGTNEGFNEVWWFYCSAGSQMVDKYVVYNYGEDIWYYGTMGRTAWLDSGLRDYPLASTYTHNLVDHEIGVDDNETGTTLPIAASIGSSEFDIDDGHNFGFVWRVLPDLTFRNSTGEQAPQCNLTLIPMRNSGSGFTTPASTNGTSTAEIQRIATAPIEEFTGQVYIRVRGRQLIFKVDSDRVGTTWQLGIPRIDLKPDGRR